MSKELIVLMGIKHCGKTTQGKRLAAFFNCPFYDTDAVLQDLTGKSAREIYSQEGKEAFMQAEASACEKIMAAEAFERLVIATGGGFCNNKKAIDVLRCKNKKEGKSIFVFMKADEKVAADRIVKEITYSDDNKMQNLPAYIAVSNPKNEDDVRNLFHEFYEERCRIYTELSDITIEMPPVSKEENTKRLLKVLNIKA
ncbi:MAG: hypothetical protein K6F69_01105 [Treponema sp.]|nr:hypothetical protein [Treponema sp.]